MWQSIGTTLFWMLRPLLAVLIRRTRRTRLLLRVGGEVLVTKTWLSDGRWSLPGGGLHRGETPLAGVIRETREETGIIMQPRQVKPLLDTVFQNHGLQFRCFYFVAELPAKPDLKLQRFEISGGRWVRPATITQAEYGPDVIAAVQATPAAL